MRQFACHIQPQPGAFGAGGEKRLEQARLVFGRYARAVVHHGERYGYVVVGGLHQNGDGIGLLTAVLPGVVDEVPYNLLQVHFIEIHFQRTALHIKVHGVFGFGVGEQEFLLEIEPEFHQVDGLRIEAVALIQAAYFFQHFIDALDIVVDDTAQLGGHRVFVFFG